MIIALVSFSTLFRTHVNDFSTYHNISSNCKSCFLFFFIIILKKPTVDVMLGHKSSHCDRIKFADTEVCVHINVTFRAKYENTQLTRRPGNEPIKLDHFAFLKI